MTSEGPPSGGRSCHECLWDPPSPTVPRQLVSLSGTHHPTFVSRTDGPRVNLPTWKQRTTFRRDSQIGHDSVKSLPLHKSLPVPERLRPSVFRRRPQTDNSLHLFRQTAVAGGPDVETTGGTTTSFGLPFSLGLESDDWGRRKRMFRHDLYWYHRKHFNNGHK